MPRWPWLLAPLLFWWLAQPAAAATLSPLVVAHDGQSVPAAGNGVTLAWLGDAVLDDAGRVIFRAGLEGAGVDSPYDYAILRSDGAGGLELVLREGESAPGAAGAEFEEPKGSQPTGLEHIVVSSTLRGESVNFYNDQGIWLWEDPGTLSLVARDGDPAPGTGTGVVFYNPAQFEANSSGRLAFRSTLFGPGVDSTNIDGIWFHDATTGTQLVSRAGEPAPGTPAGTNFLRFPGSPEINDAGQIAFSARTTTGAGSRPGGIWSAEGAGEPLTARFLTGDAAPGTPPGVTFSALFLSDMNSGGELALNGGLSGPGVTSDDNDGIWGPDGAGGLALIAREGSPAPGVAGDARWGHLTTQPLGPASLNDAGEVAFKGGLIGSDVAYANDWGIWGPDDSGGLTLIAREGDPVPDLLGVSFLALMTLTPPLNAHGDVAFKATWLDETKEEEEVGWGLFVRTGEGAFLTVVRSGDLIEVEPGVFREVYEPRLALTGLNDARQLTFQTNFIGGSSGVFLVTVPEPGTAALLALGLAALTVTTRKRRQNCVGGRDPGRVGCSQDLVQPARVIRERQARLGLLVAVPAVTILLFSRMVAAYPVSFQIEGVVTGVSNPDGLLDSSITVGTVFVGSYQFDSELPNTLPYPPDKPWLQDQLARYESASADYGFTIELGSYSLQTSGIWFQIENDLGSYPGNDHYRVFSNEYGEAAVVSGPAIDVDGLGFLWYLRPCPERPEGSICDSSNGWADPLSSPALPLLPLDLDQWEQNDFSFEGVKGPFCDPIPCQQTFSISATVTQLILIPEPSTALLFAFGLAGLAAAGRRRRSQSS